ncbi:MAG: formamidopyrimidine-DNA glycosylase [Kiritimatiellaceae bacterium]|nr:formamidopyrimidine-DNA glycosylase [Kiritimatiellaceae bacterium]
MPELPEVETIARQLRERGVEGREILALRIDWPRMVEPLTPAAFSNALCGTKINTVSRTGKWIQIQLSSGQHWMVHLRMAGSFSKRRSKFDRAEVLLSGGMKLYFRDTRKFGRWKLVDDPQEILGQLGPDALSKHFTGTYLEQQLTHRKRAIKPLLLDQSLIAGIGNIYADEALWATSIHPQRCSSSLTPEERKALYRAIRHVLRIGVQNRGTSLGKGQTNYRDMNGESGSHRKRVKAYGRKGLPCERCGTPLIKIVVVQRGTTLCPTCQVR